VSTSLVALEQLQRCAEATTESIQHEMLMVEALESALNAASSDNR